MEPEHIKETMKKLYREFLRNARVADSLEHKLKALEKEYLIATDADDGMAMDYQKWELKRVPPPR